MAVTTQMYDAMMDHLVVLAEDGFTKAEMAMCAGRVLRSEDEIKAVVEKVYTRHAPPVKPAPKSFDPDEHPAYAMPLRDLVTLWQARHGDKWVPTKQDVDTLFWGQAINRLQAANMVETINGFVRIKEV